MTYRNHLHTIKRISLYIDTSLGGMNKEFTEFNIKQVISILEQ